ncbi:hypothetical protein CERSUDRAFT_107214 [Gelatoporia subvermispora B]|uniref:Mid2 domain-containing protein n=1 Tax=Ceriporiopsis subvermispora (strain B) TaxID=914234 RepID=M2R7B1_CERS8|nr:hypothetical protein CERSUDRAFT_107214 [Gelatoporia subvermispora B]
MFSRPSEWTLIVLALVYFGASEVINIDDTDSRIIYTGIWSLFGNFMHGNNSQGFDDTLALCQELGGQATLSFVGTQISVYGARGPAGVILENSTYSIDNGPVKTWFRDDNITSIMYNVTFFTSPTLADGMSHTLVITNFGTWFFLDRIQVTISDTLSSLSAGASTPSSSGTGSSSSILSGPTITASLPLSPISATSISSSSSSSHSLSKGTIVGVSIGASIALACVTLAVYLLRNKIVSLNAYLDPASNIHPYRIDDVVESGKGLPLIPNSSSAFTEVGPSVTPSASGLSDEVRFETPRYHEVPVDGKNWRSITITQSQNSLIPNEVSSAGVDAGPSDPDQYESASLPTPYSYVRSAAD